MRRREETDPVVARRFAAVWPRAAAGGAAPPAWRTSPDPASSDGASTRPVTTGPPGGVDRQPPGRPIWPPYPVRTDSDVPWGDLDQQGGQPSGTARPAPEPPVPVDSAAPAEPPAIPPGPPGRSVLGGFDPGRRGLRVLAAIAVVVVLVAGYLAWRSRPRPQPAPSPTGSAASLAPAGPAAPTGMIVVAVQGKVARPGLYRLPAGARVADALAAAGGAQPGVDLSFVNVARKLVDGELLVIGATPPPDQGGPATPPGKLDLNTATVNQLDALPGIGPALAQRIVDYRTQHGGFRSVDDLHHVEGIGDAKFAQLKDLVTV